MSVLGIDFGTSRIKAAYWDEEKGEAVMLPLGKRGQLYVPSLFHVGKDGKIRFGEEAETMLHHDPQGVLENLKLKLDKPIQYIPNGTQKKSSELMSLLFKRLIEYASREVKCFGGKVPEKLVLTLPSRWDYGDIYTDALVAAGHKGEKIFLREPEAAGWAWIAEEKPQAGEMLVVLDFGGGTVDWATLQVDETGRPKMIPDLPPGGITAAGAHVDDGLFDEMMKRLSEEQKKYVIDHRSLVMEQIRQMKESQNAKATLSGEGKASLEIMLGPDVFTFERNVFDEVVKREAVDHAVEGIGSYVKKVLKTAKETGKKQLVCALVGGTRMLSGLEDQVKGKVTEIAKETGIEIKYAKLGQADFATVRGAVRRVHPERKADVKSVQLASTNENDSLVQSLKLLINEGDVHLNPTGGKKTIPKQSLNDSNIPNGLLHGLKKLL
ncbi:Molecular chaperone-like protein [Chloroherpeton thalassium ATCC 35110]|uniref:Molecular chaperone-like protein n=1 Tax=Chloroherpeton thalassium (strain ATCC 35110 / GB-78) TaxID=517418 RepID=B3QWN3_CHLT3|nr:Hsp70 family protein [Chloroherpeton thalassium]ACF14793.1 Molecular chaperone-like protein [Chloroherpeton thalassium ATCC 35110]